jgi:hypothetical protein
MFERYSCWRSELWSDAASLGKPQDQKDRRLADSFMPKATTIPARTLTVSASPSLPCSLSDIRCFHRLQTVLHSVLSTRILLHTAMVLRQDVVGSHATVAQNRRPHRMRFAEVTIDTVPEEVEL